MAELVVLRKLHQFKTTTNLRYALAAVALWSLSYFISCYLHTSPSSAAFRASSLFSSDACSDAAFPDSPLDFTSRHSADILLANSDPQGETLHGETGFVDSDSDSLGIQDVAPVATIMSRRGLLRLLAP